MTNLPFALGCPSCVFYLEVSPEDPDASVSDLHSHIYRMHASSPHHAGELLAKARELTEQEVAR